MAPELTGSHPAAPVSLRVQQAPDAVRAGELARVFAVTLGFPADAGEEIAIVTRELATNLLRHAGGGSLTFAACENQSRIGIRIDSEDSGPGIADFERAITDGYSTAGGLGLGLGTVNRLMDEVDVYCGPRGGLHLVCQRWLRPRPPVLFSTPLSFGAATRPRRPYEDNGDTFIIKQWEGHALAGIIDGLGHGPLAHRASLAARQYIEQHFDQPLPNLFRGVGRACRATRGVVMALAHFDFRQQTLAVASLGNIEMKLEGSRERFSPIVRRGILGLNAPDAVSTEHPWTPACVLIMHSDGVRAHWDWTLYKHLASQPATAIAPQLLQVLAKEDDDATVLVARSVPL